jgi:DNA-binding LytR/AlgR family response regulator
MSTPTALIADDEPLLRKSLQRLLAAAWPELQVVALVRNGREAVERFEALRPDVCFLDVHMPGLSGVEAARMIGRRAQLVFVTAHSEYAVEAFAQGALDYLVKPIEAARLADTVARLQDRLRTASSPPDIEAALLRLAARLQGGAAGTAWLQWLRASVGATLRLIPTADVDYLRADEKYTRVAWHDAAGRREDAVIRTPLKELAAQLDPAQFAQVHRAVIVNLRAVDRIVRGENETAQLHVKGRDEVLPVSRGYLHQFRQM